MTIIDNHHHGFNFLIFDDDQITLYGRHQCSNQIRHQFYINLYMLHIHEIDDCNINVSDD